jgi:hypothetical protein
MRAHIVNGTKSVPRPLLEGIQKGLMCLTTACSSATCISGIWPYEEWYIKGANQNMESLQLKALIMVRTAMSADTSAVVG